MQSLSEKIDQCLLDLTWSLWTELGVAGIKRQHQNVLISLEELIVLTSLLGDKDPRLRNEALDWCARYHQFVSISRLHALIKNFGEMVHLPYSVFAKTLNMASRAKWPIFVEVEPLNYSPSGKSQSPQCIRSALLSLRLRALFGVGARADLMTFFLTQKKEEFTAADTTEIGYSKRSLSTLLEDLVSSGFFDSYIIQNKRYYRFIKKDQMTKMIGEMPKIILPWKLLLEVLLPLRVCIVEIENKSEATKMIEVRNMLKGLENKLHRMQLSLPPMHVDPIAYWDSFSDWILQIFCF